MKIERREFLAQSAFAALGVTTPTPTPAPVPVPESLAIESAIANNHGHEVKLSPVEVVKALRLAHLGTPVSLDIKGGSTHPHAIALSEDLLLALLAVGQVQATSSVVGSHSHAVTIALLVKPAQA
ncbi:MAG: hypothetical protein ABL958_18130 [Bdellovibrionia bacterium]